MAFEMQDVYKAVQSVKLLGRHRDDVEAFVLNSDDLHELFMKHPIHEIGIGPLNSQSGDELKLLGVKIIESYHVPRGTILKIFKDDQKKYSPEYSDGTLPGYQPTVPGSGSIYSDYVVPNVSGAIQGMKKLDASTEQAAKAIKNFESAIADGLNEATENLPTTEEKEEEKEPRHSTTRKVQLD